MPQEVAEVIVARSVPRFAETAGAGVAEWYDARAYGRGVSPRRPWDAAATTSPGGTGGAGGGAGRGLPRYVLQVSGSRAALGARPLSAAGLRTQAGLRLSEHGWGGTLALDPAAGFGENADAAFPGRAEGGAQSARGEQPLSTVYASAYARPRSAGAVRGGHGVDERGVPASSVGFAPIGGASPHPGRALDAAAPADGRAHAQTTMAAPETHAQPNRGGADDGTVAEAPLRFPDPDGPAYAGISRRPVSSRSGTSQPYTFVWGVV